MKNTICNLQILNPLQLTAPALLFPLIMPVTDEGLVRNRHGTKEKMKLSGRREHGDGLISGLTNTSKRVAWDCAAAAVNEVMQCVQK